MKLTSEELKELKTVLGTNLDGYVERLSNYIKSTGKNYKDHRATILLWFEKDKTPPKKSTVFTEDDYERGEHL